MARPLGSASPGPGSARQESQRSPSSPRARQTPGPLGSGPGPGSTRQEPQRHSPWSPRASVARPLGSASPGLWGRAPGAAVLTVEPSRASDARPARLGARPVERAPGAAAADRCGAFLWRHSLGSGAHRGALARRWPARSARAAPARGARARSGEGAKRTRPLGGERAKHCGKLIGYPPWEVMHPCSNPLPWPLCSCSSGRQRERNRRQAAPIIGAQSSSPATPLIPCPRYAAQRAWGSRSTSTG